MYKVEPRVLSTSADYSPHDQLPTTEPKDTQYPIDYFYHNTAKFLIKDTVRIMNNGLHIDMDKVIELEKTLDAILVDVQSRLDNNPLVQKYLKERHKDLIRKYKEERATKLKKPEYFIKPFKHNDKVHRSYFMYLYAQSVGMTQPKQLLPTGIPEWPAKLVKKVATNRVLKQLLDKTLSTSHHIAVSAMKLLAEHKCAMHNKSYLEQIASPDIPLPSFNPGSSQQKKELFLMLGIESEKTSKTSGEASFDRDEVERINKETDDEVVKEITQCFIDHSFAAIVRNNFIEAFYNYSVNGYLYGTLRLFGAKSFRLTSNNP